MAPDADWWRGAVIYQIYPRSYKDTSGNGIGDLKGITEKLDYIASLGVDGIWVSPFLQSPMKDYGYDISDYYAIDPVFGTMDDFKAMLDKAHGLGLKFIMDMVLSHTSAQHPWFTQSKQDRTNPKADWYVWADPKPDGSPPNNWLSIFGGPAWQYYPLRGQYYLHNFLKSQPDLNFHNPEVAEEMLNICRHWLDFGVDGFRLDAINFCMHDPLLRNNPPKDPSHASTQLDFPDAYSMQAHVYSKSRPENIDFMRKIRKLLDEAGGRFSLAEIGDDNALKTSVDYTGAEDVLHSAYSFDLMGGRSTLPPPEFFIKTLKAQIELSDVSWPSWAFSNHDVIRAASRWSGSEYGHDPQLSKLLPVLLTSLRGTAFLYQGEELGLPEADISFDKLCDPWGLYLWPKWQGRDGCRTPMPWTSGPKAGFTDAEETWLPIPESHLPLSVEAQEQDKHSTLHTVREFLHWRKGKPALKTGNIEFLDRPGPVLAFERTLSDDKILCIFNLSGEEQEIPASGTPQFLSDRSSVKGGTCTLPAYGYMFIA